MPSDDADRTGRMDKEFGKPTFANLISSDGQGAGRPSTESHVAEVTIAAPEAERHSCRMLEPDRSRANFSGFRGTVLPLTH